MATGDGVRRVPPGWQDTSARERTEGPKTRREEASAPALSAEGTTSVNAPARTDPLGSKRRPSVCPELERRGRGQAGKDGDREFADLQILF